MGVDFQIQVVTPSGSTSFEPVRGDRTWFSARLFFVSELLKPEWEGVRVGEKVRSLLPRPVSFRWFEEAYSETAGRDPDLRDCWSPSEVLETLRDVLAVLKEHDREFPPFFSFAEGHHHGRVGGYKMFVEGRPFYLRGGWGRCVAILDRDGMPAAPGGEEIDLTGQAEVRCRPAGITLLRGEVVEGLGPEITVRIERASCFEHFRESLESMVEVCTIAARGDHLVFTYVN